MKEILWSELHRPKTVNDTILPERFKEAFNKMVADDEIPNLILSGSPGVGKTSVAKAMLDELGCSSMIINGSLDGTKDALRNEIKDFASTVSMQGGRKYVILDEADGLTHQMQPALKAFMEEFSENAGFILTCNLPHKIIPAIHSRCSMVEFKFSREEKQDLFKKALKRIFDILKIQNVEYDPKAVAVLLQKYSPDIRKTINELQKYSANGKIDTGILTNVDDISFKKLIEQMQNKSFDGMRNWISENDMDHYDIYSKLYDNVRTYYTPDSSAMAVVLLADYQYKASFAINPDINLQAALLELSSLEWK